MKFRLFAVLRHACTMVGRRIKTYAFLSVTIILSFSFLLGYLMLTDSQQYNQYKRLFERRRGDVYISENVQNTVNMEKQNMLYQNLNKIENTVYFTAYMGWIGDMSIYYDPTVMGMSEAESPNLSNLCAWFLPDGAWLDLLDIFVFPIDNEIVWTDGRDSDEFQLDVDEVVLSEQVYRLLKMDCEKDPIFHLRTELRNGTSINTQLKVVGYAKGGADADYHNIDTWDLTPGMFLSVKFLDWLGQNDLQLYGEGGIVAYRTYYIFTDAPEKVTSLAETMGYFSIYSVYEQQNNALKAIQTQMGNKAIIACALLVLLGINLYSSFSNAMNERKYEIGVKRAVGASAWSIVRQFLYESLIVMLANVAISIALVANVGVLYKIFMEWQSNFLDTYVLYLTPHSMVIFGVCAVALTVVFSLIFAYKSTQVEIVQYLKAE